MKNDSLHIPPLLPHCQGYSIYFEKDLSEGLKNLPTCEWPLLETLYLGIQEDPQKHLDPLLLLHLQYPTVFEIVNLLTFARIKLRDKKMANILIEKAFLEFPDSLIAKINYADLCLRQKKWKEVGNIFQHHTDLNTLYPQRKKYHFSEFRGFMIVMGFYHLHLKEIKKAQDYYELAFQVDPLHPSISILERELKKSLPLLQKLAHIFKIP